MATIEITPQALSVRFSIRERIGGLLRDITVPRSAVVDVVVEPDGMGAVSGLRAPGLALPGVRNIGTWRGFGDAPRRTAVSVRAGEPAVRITLRGQKWDQLIIGDPAADERVAELSGQRPG